MESLSGLWKSLNLAKSHIWCSTKSLRCCPCHLLMNLFIGQYMHGKGGKAAIDFKFWCQEFEFMRLPHRDTHLCFWVFNSFRWNVLFYFILFVEETLILIIWVMSAYGVPNTTTKHILGPKVKWSLFIYGELLVFSNISTAVSWLNTFM